jgi:FkbM family methyltransferase
MYSQNNEEEIILNYFKDSKGTFLDLGAHNGIDLSNTRALVEKGWQGSLVEPHPQIFQNLKENCKNFDGLQLFEFAIGVENGTFDLNANDTFLSTLKESEIERWNGEYSFYKIKCKVLNFNKFIELSIIKKFDFISIDCEGVDYEILTQINLDEVGCKMICIETNGIETQKYIDYISNFGFNVVAINAENLIMAR